MPLDYETLRVIWWLLLGVLLIGFAVMDGFDLGVGILLPFVARRDAERRVAINTVGPVWEGNQVWLILGAGAIFAAWPPLYATAFSGFYIAMFLVLAALILRPVGFKFRSKVADPRWRRVWDGCLFLGGFVPALIFGVAVGNAIQGVPFRFDERLLSIYEGGFFGLLNPFALLAGVTSLAMLTLHGACYLAAKTHDPIAGRARRAGSLAAVVFFAAFALAGLWVLLGLEGYALVSEARPDGPSYPLAKEVARAPWAAVYDTRPWALAAPALGFAGVGLAALLLRAGRAKAALAVNGAGIAGVIATPGLLMFPFMLPSSLDPNSSLIVWDSSSSHLTLFIMLIATAIFLPLIILYTSWVYHVMRGKVTEADVESSDSAY